MAKRQMSWVVALVLAAAVGGWAEATAASLYDPGAMATAGRLCSLRKIPGDQIDCAHSMIDRWAAMETDARNAVVRKQADGFLKTCSKLSGDAFEICAERAAAALGDAYVDPAITVAKWDKETADNQAVDKAVEQERVACVKAGLPLGSPALGMSAKQALACGWGAPSARRRLTTGKGVTEVWVYDASRSVTLSNGRVSAIAD